MSIALQLLQKANQFYLLANNLERIVADELVPFESLMEDLNIAQLQAGKNSDDSDIKPDYKDLTIEIKKIKGQPTDRVTLRDTGDFHRSIQYKVDMKGVNIQATDPKTPELKEKYGEGILGLNEEHLQDVIDNLRIELQKRFYKELII